ncbi:MAG TPA: family 20 glycosylhydrolase, partial [Chthoniobacteraceae bacterium]|nr:family 20 glycosylhydrolase [Chthoniobacteraceae bacterium]
SKALAKPPVETPPPRAHRSPESRCRRLVWKTADVDAQWQPGLRALADLYPITEDAPVATECHELRIKLRDSGDFSGQIERRGSLVTIEAHRRFPVGRLLSWALADRLAENQPIEDHAFFERQGIMFDVARNAALSPKAFRKWFSQMFLMGYNHASLYLEDMLTLEGEPYFGYLRGRYTEEELRQIDEDGAAFGIEVTAAIQTLSHLAQVLKWPAYKGIKRNAHTVGIGKAATYQLIEKMVKMVSQSIRSRRIHIGMDEAPQTRFSEFQEHLKKVNAICQNYGYNSVDIWSDMYFRLNSQTHDYYDKKIVIPKSMAGCVPEGVNLVYWDYNTFDEKFYAEWIGKHQELSGGKLPSMAAGLWTWRNSFWYSQRRINSTVTPAIAACRQTGVKAVLFTMWRDDGAYCHYESTLGGLAYAADRCFRNDRWTAETFDTVIGVPHAAILAVSSIDDNLFPTMIAWDDPLIGVAHKMFNRVDAKLLDKAASGYAEILKTLAPVAEITEPVDFAFGVAMVRFLYEKIVFQQRLDKAYAEKDRVETGRLANAIPELISVFEGFIDAFRRQWQNAHRPFGLEVMQARFGCQLLRLRDAKMRLEDYAAGRIDTLEELDEEIAFPLPCSVTGEQAHLAINWNRIYTGC